MKFLKPLQQLNSYFERRLQTKPFLLCILKDSLQVWSQFPLHNKGVPLRLNDSFIYKRGEVMRTFLRRASFLRLLRDFPQNIDFRSVYLFSALFFILSQADILNHPLRLL